MAFGMDYEKILRRHVLEEELRGVPVLVQAVAIPRVVRLAARAAR